MDYDFIIVGSGSAGSLVANRLTKNPNTRVLLLEAGGEDRNFWLRLPVGYFRTMVDERFARNFETQAGEGTAARSIVWPRGRVIGGSSSINGLIFIRGQHEDFDDWEKLGASGWGYRDVLPHFRRLEKYGGGENQYRGALGELGVSNLRNRNSACDAWLAAARESGLPANPDFNGESTYGVGEYQLSIDGRWRASSARAFLAPARKRANLTVQTQAHAAKVLFEGTRASGVEWIQYGTRHRASAACEVILCAGALQSPQLLQLSGIGPAALLKEHGIDVIKDAAGVGKNLQDHYQIRTIVQLEGKESLNDHVRNPIKLAQMGMQWLFSGTGPLTVGAGQVGGAAMTRHAAEGRPDVQFLVMPLSVDRPGQPLHHYSGFTAVAWQCHPHSRGELKIQSTDPLQQVHIDPRYLSETMDQNVMVDAVKMLRGIYRQPAFKDMWNKEVSPGAGVESDDDILNYVRESGGTVFHAVGTCRMGEDDDAVVDSQLRVRGVHRLRVIDASVMPKVTSANTNAPTLMIAQKGVEGVLQEYGL